MCGWRAPNAVAPDCSRRAISSVSLGAPGAEVQNGCFGRMPKSKCGRAWRGWPALTYCPTSTSRSTILPGTRALPVATGWLNRVRKPSVRCPQPLDDGSGRHQLMTVYKSDRQRSTIHAPRQRSQRLHRHDRRIEPEAKHEPILKLPFGVQLRLSLRALRQKLPPLSYVWCGGVMSLLQLLLR